MCIQRTLGHTAMKCNPCTSDAVELNQRGHLPGRLCSCPCFSVLVVVPHSPSHSTTFWRWSGTGAACRRSCRVCVLMGHRNGKHFARVEHSTFERGNPSAVDSSNFVTDRRRRKAWLSMDVSSSKSCFRHGAHDDSRADSRPAKENYGWTLL